MLNRETIDQNSYTAFTHGAILQRRPEAGPLVLTDADRSDFLHRMTTNNINALKPGQSAVTVLTSPTARILYVFSVICRPNELWLLPAPGQTTALERHLRGQIFFMDKVKVRNASVDYSRLRLMGPQAGELLGRIGLAPGSLTEGGWVEQEGVFALKQTEYDIPGYELLTPVANVEAFMARLQAVGALALENDAVYQAHRVELGRPATGAELTDAYNPLEAGLAWTCADNKGCYTGQEIIARQVTYDKITKTLVGLRSAQPLAVGADLIAERRNAGVVTSVTYSPTLQAPIALAIVKKPHHTPGTHLMAGEQSVQVVELPFVAVE